MQAHQSKKRALVSDGFAAEVLATELGALLISGALLAMVWVATLVAATRLQELLIFGSTRVLRPAPLGPYGGYRTQSVSLPVHDGDRLAGWLTTPTTPPTRLAVWFGGRNEDVGWVPALASWLGPEWAVCSFNYRGCGSSTGRPGETACVGDATTIVSWASQQTGVPLARIVLMGRSLGSGVAMQVAARQAPAGLVLLSPPASLRRLLMRHPLLAPALPFLRHRFDSLAVAPQVRCPSLLLLAERDRRVPHSESRRLARALHGPAPGSTVTRCRLIMIAGTDHRSLPRDTSSLAAVAQFVRAL